MCNADQCRSMCDQISDINPKCFSIKTNTGIDQCLKFDRTLISIDRHCTLISHVLKDAFLRHTLHILDLHGSVCHASVTPIMSFVEPSRQLDVVIIFTNNFWFVPHDRWRAHDFFVGCRAISFQKHFTGVGATTGAGAAAGAGAPV